MGITDFAGACGAIPNSQLGAPQDEDACWGLEAALPFLLPALPDLPDGPAAAA